MANMKTLVRELVPFLRSASVAACVLCATLHLQAQTPREVSPQRITGIVDESALITLPGNTHPLAQSRYDRGPAPVSMPANRLLLVLSRSKQQEADLQTYLQSVQDPNSPDYHRFLSPAEFGKRYGAGDSDLQTIQTWLSGHGLKVNRISKGRTAIEISGTVGQIQETFHTSVHSYVIGGKQYWANATDPQIPAALSPVVAGLASLHSFRPRAQNIPGPDGVYDPATHTINPTYTVGSSTSGYSIYLGPADAATIYNTPTSLNANVSGATYDGSGVTIGIAGDSNINLQQNYNYRDTFGLPAKGITVVVDGADPGVNGDAIEAYLDTQVAGGLAPNANVILYTAANTDYQAGLFLAISRALDDNEADILNVSFGACESAIGAAGNQYISSLWEQAAAQGVAVTVSSGDSGSAGCDNPNTEQVASSGLGVNGIGSTPYNISVGGTDYDVLYSNFPTSFTNYVDVTNTFPNHRSALKYIPEEPWNDSTWPNLSISQNKPVSVLTGSTSNNNIIAGGGGISTVYPLPSWQSGFSSGTGRSLPDVSLLAGNGFYGAVWGICTDVNPSVTNCTAGALGNSFSLTGVGGTSASSPAFAGMLALIQQKTGSRLGQADYVLYDLAKSKYATVFHDVTSGNNSVNCTSNTPACALNSSSYFFLTGYNAGSSYDEASGLGSVDATQLANSWATAGLVATSSSLQLNGATTALSITHGQSVTVNANVTSGNGTPTGMIALVDNLSPATQPNAESIASFTLSGGTATGTTNQLPGGSYQVSAHYGGSSSFDASDSNAVPVTVGAESSTTAITNITAYDPASMKAAATPHYGFIFKIDAMPYGNSASATQPNGIATGSLTFMTGTTALGTAPLDSSSTAELTTTALPAGTNSLTASFPGDASFTASTSAPLAYSVPQAPTSLSLVNAMGMFVVGSTITLNANLSNTDSLGAAPTGTVTFYSGSTALGAVPLSGTAGGGTVAASGSASLTTTALPVGTDSITATYSGDGNYSGSTSSASTMTIVQVVPFMTVVPAQQTIPASQTLNVTVTLAASGTLPLPSGTVTLSTTGYTSAAVNLVNGAATITIPANTLPAGPDTLTAKYSGDTDYATASATAVVTVDSVGAIAPTVTITPSSTTITSYPVSVTVTVAGTSGNPTPTGSVTLATPAYVTAPQALTNGSATFSIAANQLVPLTNTLTATYFGDSVYAAATGTTTVNVPELLPPTINVSPTADTITVDQSIAVTISIGQLAGNPVPTGTVWLTGAGYTSAQVTLANASASITIPPNSLSVGSDSISVLYSGDSNYAPGSTAVVYVVNQLQPSFTVSGTAVSVVPGATAGNTSTITVTPSDGFTGSVVLSAAITSSPAGAANLPILSFGNKNAVSITGSSAASATLIVTTSAPTTAALHQSGRPGWLGGGAALACMLFFGIASRRRRWQTLLGLLVFLGFLCGGILSCGGSPGGTTGSGSAGTTPGTYQATVTGTSGTSSVQTTISVQVQ